MSQLLLPHSDGEHQSVFCCKAAYSSFTFHCLFLEEGGGGDWEGPRFPGERKVSLAREGDSNGHQASFQTERKGTVKREGGGGEQGSNENHPSISWRQWQGERKKKSGFEGLEAFPEAHQPISWDGCLSPSLCLSVLIKFTSWNKAVAVRRRQRSRMHNARVS